MERQPLKITLDFADINEARKVATALKELDPSAVVVSDIAARQLSGASIPQYLLEFLAQIPTDIGIGLLSSLLYDALKGGGEELRSRFSIRIGKMTISCETQEDLRNAIEIARQAEGGNQLESAGNDDGHTAAGP